MLFNKSSLCVLALATYTAAKTVDVQVGDGGKKFTPNEIEAEVDDEVVFHFAKNGHDVSQSSFDEPCQPLSGSPIFSGELDSGEEFKITIQNTDPIWLYCSQGNHCKKGMTAVINAPSDGNTLDDYTKAAGGASSSTPSEVNDGSSGGDSESTATGTEAATSEPTGAASTILTQNSMVFNAVVALFVTGGTWFGLA